MKFALAALLVAVLAVPSAYAKADYHGLPPAGAAAQGAGKIAVCAACHGVNGIGMSPVYPNLAGQQYNYILKELENFRSGARKSSIMSGMAMTIAPAPHHANLKDIAAYFAGLEPMWAVAGRQSAPVGPAAQMALGKIIYERGVAADNIPACAACHGLSAEGNGPMAIPALAGQHAAYMVTQLEQFASGKRTNSPGRVMYTIARALTAAQTNAVADYLQSLDPRSTLGIGPKDLKAYARTLESHGVVHDTNSIRPAPAARSAAPRAKAH